jgi:hypothetical protein
MFPQRFFAGTFYPERYFPKVGAEPVEGVLIIVSPAGYTDPNTVSARGDGSTFSGGTA